jgi:hypothetical protein
METITTTESRTDALRRLLEVAKESGVRLLRDDAGEMWTTSVSDPGWLHKLEPDSCSCRGFARAGRCRHQAALWSHLGWLDGDGAPEPTPAAGCPVCHGAGTITVAHSRWVGGSRLGFRDQWTTAGSCPVCRGEEVAA